MSNCSITCEWPPKEEPRKTKTPLRKCICPPLEEPTRQKKKANDQAFCPDGKKRNGLDETNLEFDPETQEVDSRSSEKVRSRLAESTKNSKCVNEVSIQCDLLAGPHLNTNSLAVECGARHKNEIVVSPRINMRNTNASVRPNNPYCDSDEPSLPIASRCGAPLGIGCNVGYPPPPSLTGSSNYPLTCPPYNAPKMPPPCPPQRPLPCGVPPSPHTYIPNFPATSSPKYFPPLCPPAFSRSPRGVIIGGNDFRPARALSCPPSPRHLQQCPPPARCHSPPRSSPLYGTPYPTPYPYPTSPLCRSSPCPVPCRTPGPPHCSPVACSMTPCQSQCPPSTRCLPRYSRPRNLGPKMSMPSPSLSPPSSSKNDSVQLPQFSAYPNPQCSPARADGFQSPERKSFIQRVLFKKK